MTPGSTSGHTMTIRHEMQGVDCALNGLCAGLIHLLLRRTSSKISTRLIYLTGEEDGVQGGEVRKAKFNVFEGMLTSVAADIDVVPSGS
jgi:hypothetical protein